MNEKSYFSNFKKIASVMLSIMMMFSLCTPAFATTGESNESVSFNDLILASGENSIQISESMTAVLTESAALSNSLVVDAASFELDLNGNTLSVDGDNKFINDANVTIKNGTLNITGAVATGDAIFGIGNYSTNAVLTLQNVDVMGNGYSSAYAIFYVYGSSTLNVEGGSVNVANDNSASGGVFKAENGSEGKINITGSESNHVELVFDNAKIGFLDGTVVMDYVDLDIKGGANAINQTALTVKNSSLTIDGCDGRALTVKQGDVTVINSELNFTNASEGEIRFKSGHSINADENSTISTCTAYADSADSGAKINGVAVTGTESEKVSVTVENGETKVIAPAKGTITPAYTSVDRFWGEGKSNSTESFVVELYEGDNKIASSSLKNYEGIIDGDIYVTWSIPFEPTNDGDYWTTEWIEGYPKYNMNPTKVVLIVDGAKVAENSIQYNGPDNLNKIVALAEDSNGSVKAYKTLAEAISDGSKVNLVRDVTESISEFHDVALTTNVESGVVITNTFKDDYTNFNGVTLGKGITLNASDVYSNGADSVNVIEGALNVTSTYYHSNNAKTTVQNGGSVTTGGMTVIRYNSDPNAGLYIYGDNDDSTVEFSCANTLGAYSGSLYAEDAVIETNMIWLDYKKNSSEEPDSYSVIDAEFVNSTVNVSEEFRLYKDANLTLNSSNVTAGKIQIRQDATAAVFMDDTSTIKASAVENLSGASLNAKLDDNGYVYFERILFGTGTTEDPYLINCTADLIALQQSVDKQAPDGSTQYAGKVFKLTADIDLAGIDWNPIGTMSGDHGSFKGTFDGNGHTISNLNCQTSGNGLGLFARTSGNAEIKNLTLHNVTVKSTDNSNYVGAVVGNSYASTKITNVHVTGTIDISGRGYIGGISGHGYVVMDNVSVKGEGTIDSSFWCAGGILGYGGEGATNITNASVEGTGETGLVIRSAAGGLGSIVGMAEDNGGTQPISGSNLSAKNILIQTYAGAYGTGYAEYALGYLYGGNPTSKLTGDLIIEDVQFETSTGITNPTINDIVALVENKAYLSLSDALDAAQDGDTVTLLQDVDYAGKTSLEINKAIVLDLNGKSLTTHGTYGGLRLKGGVSVVNGTLNHEGTVTAIKAWNVDKLENLTINVTPKEGKTIGGIVLQEGSETRINSINNVTINGATNGIETYNCGNASQDVIGSMDTVVINATNTGLLLSAPVGTASNCTINGTEYGIVMHRKGTYSVTLDLVNSTVSGKQPIHVYDETYFDPSKTNIGEISLTLDESTKLTGASGNQLITVLCGNNESNGEIVVSAEKAYVPKLHHVYLNTDSECITVDMGNIEFIESVELNLYSKDGELLTTSILNTEEFSSGLYVELTGKVVMYGRSGKSWNQADWIAWDSNPGYEVALVIDGTEVSRTVVTDKQNGTEITAEQWINFPNTKAIDGDLYYAYLNAENECITVDMGDVAFRNSVELKLYTKDGELLTTSVLDTNEIKSGVYSELTGKIVMYGRTGKTWNQADWTAWDDKPGYEVALVVDDVEVERLKVTDKQNGTEITAEQWISFPKTMEKVITPTPTPTPDSTVEPVITPTPAPSVPNTSDGSNVMMYSVFAISTLIAAIALTMMKKRQMSK